MTKAGEAPGKSWARNGRISDPLARAEFNIKIIHLSDRLRGSLGLMSRGQPPSGICLGVYVKALAETLRERIINLRDDARPGVVIGRSQSSTTPSWPCLRRARHEAR
jgi:hypothetical protein